MSPLDSPLIPPAPRESSPDGLDRLLRAYFQAALPAPWPAWQPPPAPVRPRTFDRQSWRSRLALAAAVLLLFTGSLGLSHVFQPSEALMATGSPQTWEATHRSLSRKPVAPRLTPAPRTGQIDRKAPR